MKKTFLTFIAIFTIAIGFQSTFFAQPLLAGVVIKANRVNAGVGTNGSGTTVFAEFTNLKSETVYITWKLLLNGTVVDKGSCYVAPQEKYRSTPLKKIAPLTDYTLDWNYE